MTRLEKLNNRSKVGDRYALRADIKDAAGVGNRTGLYIWRVALVEILPSYKPLGIESNTSPLRFEHVTAGGPNDSPAPVFD